MADEKVNASPEESKIPEAPAPSGPGDPPAPEHTEGPAVPGGDHPLLLYYAFPIDHPAGGVQRLPPGYGNHPRPTAVDR